MLGYAYYRVSVDVAGLEVVTLMRMIVYGIIATFLLFWSLSGFVLRIAMWRRSFYYRGLNSFTLREFYTRINTTAQRHVDHLHPAVLHDLHLRQRDEPQQHVPR